MKSRVPNTLVYISIHFSYYLQGERILLVNRQRARQRISRIRIRSRDTETTLREKLLERDFPSEGATKARVHRRVVEEALCHGFRVTWKLLAASSFKIRGAFIAAM